jgi:hypothetical protein
LPTLRSERRHLLPAIVARKDAFAQPNQMSIQRQGFEESNLQANASLLPSVLLALWR